MTHLILKILFALCPIMKERYPSGIPGEDAIYHVAFYLKWGWILPPIWVIQILYRESITDGHLRRILNNTESDASYLDFRVDLLTRFAGLFIPALTYLLIGLNILCLS